ncbi:MAG: NUDIX hydrolase [Candidatus Aenigmarchaeota archaeon]|nr:NUDIX hydrolase [Candidatus Aenigmarchaeota archaeon]
MKRRKFYASQYAAILKDKKLLMLRDAEHGKLRGKWVFPGGHIDEETDTLSALSREVKEETNLNLKSAAVFHTTIKKYPKGWTMIIYYKCKATGKIRLDHENDAYKWISSEDAKDMKFRDEGEKKIVSGLLGGKT